MLIVVPEKFKVTDEQFEQLCQANDEVGFETNSEGELIVVSPTGGDTSKNNVELSADFVIWNRKSRLGVVFDSNVLFVLPNGAKRGPDISWVLLDRWNQLTLEQRKKFPPICPDFVLELRSPSDRLSVVQAKMQEYRDNGAKLGWLINPQDRQVEIYRSSQEVKVLTEPEVLLGEEVLPDFVLSLKFLWTR